MFSLVLCAGVFVATDGAPVLAKSPDIAASLEEYKTLDAKTGVAAPEQIRLALWCEMHGLSAERVKHLARAVAVDPKNALARGLLGLMEHKGKWLAPDAMASALQKDNEKEAAALSEYNGRREALDQRTDAEKTRIAALGAQGHFASAHTHRVRAVRALALDRLKLGVWCEKAGLKPEATAEFTNAVLLDPHFDDGWKHLGYVRHDGRWMPADQAVAEQAEAKAQREANLHWEGLLKKWKAALKRKEDVARAEKNLSEVKDPRAVPMVGPILCDNVSEDQAWTVRILRRIETPASTQMLAKLAVFSAFDDVRRSALGILAHRPASDYAGLLVDTIHTPAIYAVQPVQGPGSKGVLVVDTPRYHITRSYDAPPAFKLGGSFYGYVGYDMNGLPVAARGRELSEMNSQLRRTSAAGMANARDELAAIEERTAEMIVAANLKAAAAQQRLVADIRDIERANRDAVQTNAWIGDVLHELLDAPNLKDDEDAWHRWWYDKVGYSYTPPAKVFVTQALRSIPAPSLASCFVAGTPVKTLSGPRAIEMVRPGDRVLSQDTTTGALRFQTVLAVHHNPPASTVRVALAGGDLIEPSTYHRFWIVGKGWSMARDLKAGDLLRTLGGTVKIASAEPGRVVPVFNLDVAHDHTFFAGKEEYLVHDNTLPGASAAAFDVVAATTAK